MTGAISSQPTMTPAQWEASLAAYLRDGEVSLAPGGPLHRLLSTAPPAALGPTSQALWDLVKRCDHSNQHQQLWGALRDNPGLGPHWWASQGLDIAAVSAYGWSHLYAMSCAMEPQLTTDSELLAVMLTRLATPGAFASVVGPPARDPGTPATLGEPDTEWWLMAQVALTSPHSGWNTIIDQVLPGREQLRRARLTWATVHRSYRAGLLGSIDEAALEPDDVPGPLQLLCTGTRAGMWPHLTSVALLGDVSPDFGQWLPGMHLLRSGVAQVLGCGVQDSRVDQMTQWVTQQMPRGADVGQAVVFVADLVKAPRPDLSDRGAQVRLTGVHTASTRSQTT